MMERLAKTDIKFLPGVGPRRAELLGKELDIHTFYDLLYNFPFRYIDRSTIHKISEMNGEMPYIQLKGQFISFTPQGEGAKRRLNALFSDGTGTIEVVWFNRVKYIMENYHTGKEYILFGKPTIYKSHYNMAHPEVDPYKPEAMNRGLVGVYNLTEKMQPVPERTYTDDKGNPIYSIAHYGEQNGDLMADPDMEIAVNDGEGRIIPRTFQNDYMGLFQQVFREQDGHKVYSPGLLRDLDTFLWQWLQNIEEQGFRADETPEEYEQMTIV